MGQGPPGLEFSRFGASISRSTVHGLRIDGAESFQTNASFEWCVWSIELIGPLWITGPAKTGDMTMSPAGREGRARLCKHEMHRDGVKAERFRKKFTSFCPIRARGRGRTTTFDPIALAPPPIVFPRKPGHGDLSSSDVVSSFPCGWDRIGNDVCHPTHPSHPLSIGQPQ